MDIPGNSSSENIHGNLYCEKFTMQVISSGVFTGSNPTESSLPLLLLQLGTVSLLSGLLHFIFRPVGLPRHVTDILSGIIIGPSGISRNKTIFSALFSAKGLMVLDVYETLSMVLFSFFIGLRTDVNVVIRAGRLSLVMGIVCSLLPQIINAIMLRFITGNIVNDDSLRSSLSVVAGLEGLINYHVVFTTLTEQKFVNTDLGRVALSSSMISGFCSWIMIMVRRTVIDAVKGNVVMAIVTPLCRAVLILFTLYVTRPVMFWMIKRTPEGKTLKESYVCGITLCAFFVALYSEMNGMHHIFSSILLGLAVPDGSALQSGLVDKLEGFVSGVLLPSFIVNVGRKVDICLVRSSVVGYVEVFCITSFLGKLLASMMVSSFWNMAVMDAVLIGLLVSCQGIFDIQFFALAQKLDKLSTECFSIMVIMALLVLTIVPPLVARIYNPTRLYRTSEKRRIPETKHNAEFKILACIHQEETVPTLINILEASNPTRKSPLSAYVLDLVELVGQTIPLFISHKLKRNPSSRSNRTQRIIKAFYQYESQNQGFVTVQCFTSIAPFETIHNDICLLALEKSASLIILSQGMVSSSSIKAMNINVLDNTPCSVAILVDRRTLTESHVALRPWLSYHVCLIFIGGADDREALVYANRMCEHGSISLAVLHIIENNQRKNFSTEQSLDMDAIDRFRDMNVYNNRVVYKSEGVSEGTETVCALQSLNHVDYDLIMVGRRHENNSSAMSGLVDWGEKTPDLGTIGEILVSPDIESKADVIIVQVNSSCQETEVVQSPPTPTTPSKTLQSITIDPDTEKFK